MRRNFCAVLALVLVAGFARADPDEDEALKHLKQIADVYVTPGGGANAKHAIRLDIRVKADKKPDEVAAAFRGLARFTQLEGLTVRGPEVTDEAVREFAAVKSLTYVQMMNTKATDVGVAALVPLTKLRSLVFNGAGLTDKGMVEVGKMKSLQFLSLQDAPVTDTGLKSLTPLVNLRRLIIYNSQVTPKGLEQLSGQLPALEIGDRRDI